MGRQRNRFRPGSSEDDLDPMSSFANLFDIAMVFAVALMVAFAIRSRMTEFLTGEEATFVKNAGRPDMEIIVKKKDQIIRYKAESSQGTGKGERVGTAYRLESGEIIYVPEGGQERTGE